MTIKGTLRYLDLEGGLWQLVADDGRRFQLSRPPDGHEDGARVEVEGEPDGGMSIGMSAPMLAVRRMKKV